MRRHIHRSVWPIALAAILSIVGWLALRPGLAQAADFTVTNLDDSGPGSLRQAIADVDPGGTIEFSVSGTIVLASELVISKALTIDGGQAITISGNNSVRVFNINNTGEATFANLHIVQGNAVATMGGGIYSTGAVTLTNSTLSDNQSNGGGAGGIYSNGPLTILNSTISNNNNYGGASGGGGILNYGPTTILHSLIAHNYTAGFGGGISNRGNSTISNSTIAHNRAAAGGGGIANASVALTITHSTIVSNVAESSFFGGGGLLVNVSGSTNSIGHTIVANNSSGNCKGTINSLGYNLLDVTTNCTINGDTTSNITGQNPNLGPLQDNGGPTLTHALLPGSLAIDAGNNATCPATDQRGISRPKGSTCDIGAYEFLVFVDHAATGAATGVSWTDAFTNVQDALAVVASGGEIWVATGVYTPGTARTDSFVLRYQVLGSCDLKVGQV